MIVVDSSALVATILEEPGFAAVESALLSASHLVISSVSLYETLTVLMTRRRTDSSADVHALLSALQITVVPFDELAARMAYDAYRKFGKGFHPAKLNFGDCPVYALAKSRDAALLFTGADFSRTDVRPFHA